MDVLFVLRDVVLMDVDRVTSLLDTLQAGEEAQEADCNGQREPDEEVGQVPAFSARDCLTSREPSAFAFTTKASA